MLRGLGLGLDLLAEVVAERLTRFTRKARIRIQPTGGAVRSRLYAAKAVRDEHTADDGSIELSVELPDVELMTLARTPGVQILEVAGGESLQVPCDTGTSYLQSTPVSGPKHAS